MNTIPTQTNWQLLKDVHAKLTQKGYTEEEVVQIITEMYEAIAELILVVCERMLTQADIQVLKTGSEDQKEKIIQKYLTSLEADVVVQKKLREVIQNSLRSFIQS